MPVSVSERKRRTEQSGVVSTFLRKAKTVGVPIKKPPIQGGFFCVWSEGVRACKSGFAYKAKAEKRRSAIADCRSG